MAPGLNILKIKVNSLLAFIGAERSPEPSCSHNLLFERLFFLSSACTPPRLRTPGPFANTSRAFSMSSTICEASPSGKESKHSSSWELGDAGGEDDGRLSEPHRPACRMALQATVCDFPGKKGK